jgi:hypothetical protein
MRILLILSISLFLGSCASQRLCDKRFPPETRVKDSIVIHDSTIITEKVVTKTVLKDSIVYTAAIKDSGEVDVKENQTIKFKNDKVNVVLKIKDGKLKWNIDISATESRYTSKIDSLVSELSVYKSKDSISIHDKETIKPAPSESIPWYMKLYNSAKDVLAFIGLIFVIVFLGRYAVRYFFKV